LLVALWIYRVEIRHGQETSVNLERDFSFNRNRFSAEIGDISSLPGLRMLYSLLFSLCREDVRNVHDFWRRGRGKSFWLIGLGIERSRDLG